jgi:hypothetical protein
VSAFTVFTRESQPAAGENWLESPLPGMLRGVEIAGREMILRA